MDSSFTFFTSSTPHTTTEYYAGYFITPGFGFHGGGGAIMFGWWWGVVVKQEKVMLCISFVLGIYKPDRKWSKLTGTRS